MYVPVGRNDLLKDLADGQVRRLTAVENGKLQVGCEEREAEDVTHRIAVNVGGGSKRLRGFGAAVLKIALPSVREC